MKNYKREIFNFSVLVKKYNVSGIPELIVVKPNGDIITREGRAEVQVLIKLIIQ